MNHPQQSEELKALLAAQRPTPRWLSRLRFWLRGLFAVTLLAFATIAEAATLDLDRLIPALVQVESNGNPRAVGDGGRALGALQVWSCVVADVNRAHGTRYTHRDAFDPAKARDICRRYLAIYCTPKRLGRTPTMEDAARIWNGGPNGHRKTATISYWQKVQKAL
jgi:hypothetical protein